MPARLSCLALLLCLLAGCSEDTDAPGGDAPPADDGQALGARPGAQAARQPPAAPAGPAIVRLLDALPGATHALDTAPAPASALLPSVADDLDAWWPVPRTDEPDAATPQFLARRPDAELALGPDGGGWLRVFPAPRLSDVRLRASLHARGLTAGGDVTGQAGGRISLLELVAEPDPAALHDLPGLLTATHASDAVSSDDNLSVELSVSLRGATRFVGVLVSQPLQLQDPAAGLRVSDLRLERPGLLEQARGLTGEPELFADPSALPHGPVSIRHVTRPSLALLPGARVALPAVAPDAPTRLQAWLGWVPHGDFDAGVPVALHLSVTDPAAPDAAPLLTHVARGRTRGRLAARWEQLDLPLPTRALGRELRLHVRAEAPVGSRCLAALASPRLVPEQPARAGPNVVVISLDTLRADRLGSYGYTRRPTSPRMDAFADESAVFLDTWTQAPYTLPSHVSLFSGQFPSVHGVRTHLDRPDPAATPLLAELLHERGWTTAAFTAGGYVSADFGFARGFERYGSLEPLANLESSRVRGMIERYPGTTVEMFAEQQWDAILGWLDDHARESFLLFVHTYAVHQFDPPERFLRDLGLDTATREQDDALQTWLTRFETPPDEVLVQLDELYDASVRQADTAVGRLLDRIEALGLADDTIVVLVSDHGKELGERGLVAHGHSLHEELLRVPLILRVPGRAPRRVSEPAMLVDVLPSVLEALGLPLPDGIQGVSLLEPTDAQRPLFAEVDDLAVLRALRQGPFKTIDAPLDANAVHANTIEERSYDLSLDPDERHPLPSDPRRLERVRDFRAGLEALRELLGGGASAAELSPEMAEHLRQLGYTVGDG